MGRRRRGVVHATSVSTLVGGRGGDGTADAAAAGGRLDGLAAADAADGRRRSRYPDGAAGGAAAGRVRRGRLVGGAVSGTAGSRSGRRHLTTVHWGERRVAIACGVVHRAQRRRRAVHDRQRCRRTASRRIGD
eukprot:ctg_6680.g667